MEFERSLFVCLNRDSRDLGITGKRTKGLRVILGLDRQRYGIEAGNGHGYPISQAMLETRPHRSHLKSNRRHRLGSSHSPWQEGQSRFCS